MGTFQLHCLRKQLQRARSVELQIKGRAFLAQGCSCHKGAFLVHAFLEPPILHPMHDSPIDFQVNALDGFHLQFSKKTTGWVAIQPQENLLRPALLHHCYGQRGQSQHVSKPSPAGTAEQKISTKRTLFGNFVF